MSSPITPFKLERYFAKYEFSVRYLLSPSDCESIPLHALLAMADGECQILWDELNLGYTESQGHPLLRSEIAKLYQSVSADEVIVLVPEEGILIAFQTLLKPGDHVIAIFPAYQSLHEVARSIGCRVTPWRVQLKDGRWFLDIEELEKSITPNTRLLVINFPHNPTGFHPTLAEWQRVVDLARAYHLYVFSDEMYRYLEYSESARLPSLVDVYPKAIVLGGLSKAFALPGLRVGWLATHDQQLYQDWAVYKDYTTICNSAPSEILGLIALRARERIVKRNLQIIQNNLTAAEQFFNKFKSMFKWIPPVAGSVAFPCLAFEMPVEAFCRQMLEKAQVMIVPDSMFDYSGNHFRVGLGRKSFADALEALAKALDSR